MRYDQNANDGAGAWVIELTTPVPLDPVVMGASPDTLRPESVAPAPPGAQGTVPEAPRIQQLKAAALATPAGPAVAKPTHSSPAAPKTTVPAPSKSVPAPAKPKPRRGLRTLVVIVALAVGGYWAYPRASAWWDERSASTALADAEGKAKARTDARVTSVTRQAMALSVASATSQLSKVAQQGAPAMNKVLGKWVPQLSSKCVGISVDIGPNWFPDGKSETARVTAQQLLAYNLALRERFGAVTIKPTAIGINRDKPTSGACRGQATWMSVLPIGFSDAASANAWCSQKSWPAKECQARYVAAVGSGKSKGVPRS
jgi:hypothetical protein